MKVLVKRKEQKLRMGPGKEYPENCSAYAGSIFTIVSQENGYGLLLSRAGWIELKTVDIIEED